ADSGDAELELSAVRHQPEELEQLLVRTKFSKTELQSLYRGFKNECPSGLVDEETFKLIYSQFFPQGGELGLVGRGGGKGIWGGISSAHRCGNSLGNSGWEFTGTLRWDFTGKLGWEFIGTSRKGCGCPRLGGALCHPVPSQEMLEIMKSIYDMLGRSTHPPPRDSAPAEHVELFFQKMDRNGDGVVTFEEFLETCQQVSSTRSLRHRPESS
ncbi:CSEN protein, partial [Crotophaga sulcirostris]|nr:CSEN protein [Crotophaga sulcirostris]